MKTKSDKKSFWLLKVMTLVLVLFLCENFASAETMDQFRADIILKKDGTADVTETISMDFGSESRHGIRRHIPVSYRRFNAPYTVNLQVVSVTDKNGSPYQYSSSRSGNDINLKIGSAATTVSGKQVYKIHYLASRIINWFDDQPEFYWNVTGTETPFPIGKALALVTLPAGANSSNVKVVSFEGPEGATQSAQVQKKDSQVLISSGQLRPEEGLTFAIRMPVGTIYRPKPIDNATNLLKDWYPAILLPLISLVVLYVRWSVAGKDSGDTSIAGVDWEPPKGLTPAEVGTLVDEKCDVQDVTSTLIDLAARGYLKIKKVKSKAWVFLSNTDYEITRLEGPAGAPPLLWHEQRFLEGLFDSVVGSKNEPGQMILASMLKYTFYPYFGEIKNLIYNRLVETNLFFQNPETVRRNFYTLALVLAIVGCFACIYSAPMALGLLLSAIICALFTPYMPKRTKLGVDLTRQCMGFKRFVQMAEKDRIKVLAAEDPTLFGRLLPYAMVLGAADQWATAFKDLAIPSPDWYQSDSYASDYSTNIFISDLGNSLGWFNQTLTSPPPSNYFSDTSSSGGGGGGGFSGFDSGSVGGGFGGGGTDSW